LIAASRVLRPVVVALAIATGARVQAAAPVDWKAMAAGAARAAVLAADGKTRIDLYRFELVRFEARVEVGAGWPPRLETAVAARQRLVAVAAVNGGFFDERRAPLGLRIAHGERRVPLRPKVDWGVLLLYRAGARIVHSRDVAASVAADGAIQVGPRLVVGGQPLHLKPQRARRTAVALDREGRTLTLVVVDDAIDANDLAQVLAAAGFDSALMLDGGPSTQLALELGETRVNVSGGYPVPDLLVIVSRLRRPGEGGPSPLPSPR
jgi:uncharacterized protein YigE (DUF2233 family)